MIYLSGGPSHQDMYDLKMDAPLEIRGSFKPIRTNVPGIEICEHMPRLATMMDKFAIIRSLLRLPRSARLGPLPERLSDRWPRGIRTVIRRWGRRSPDCKARWTRPWRRLWA